MISQRFHPDELRAQTLAGFDRVGGGIYPAMPDQHRAFFAALPYLFVATLDEQGWPIATLFSGPPGFLRTPDDTHLRISAPRRSDDPAQALLLPGKPVGALGLDFSNRRRNRANGTVGRTDKKPGGDRRSPKLRQLPAVHSAPRTLPGGEPTTAG